MTEQKPPFALTAEDRVSRTWSRLEQHLSDRLQQLRHDNDKPLDATETAALRGRITEVKRLLALADEAPEARVATLD